ncbi:MAG TPA: nuclear transport factor 2 family protein [Candidatus Thermoplasmatota archaeon]|nr:nuclear transport factor 2 family protein [Candidatus Thermoplasmatota archaeon]
MDPHADLAQRFFGAFAKKDIDAARACLAPHVTWHVPGQSVISGAHRGPDGVLAYFAKLRALTEGTWQAHPIDLLAGKSGAIVLARGTGARQGRRFDATYALHLRMEGGLIVEARLYPEDLSALDAFWGTDAPK